MNINGYLNSAKVTDEEIREEFIKFVGEIEAIPNRQVLELERNIEYWEQVKDDFLEK